MIVQNSPQLHVVTSRNIQIGIWGSPSILAENSSILEYYKVFFEWVYIPEGLSLLDIKIFHDLGLLMYDIV